ncbi:hypothetical protein BJP36_41645 [Moorena producens JHB]|uniref:Uncharacterized protein n=1 Tax=Moorena producens (strain JHB) TaxID=1454205 RepID=A0A9Q9UVI6_MOOP1|nr:hypothetical protein [Moorena producens]WAN68869.1 hypothetical protein BJP36_41645 [Moorena producens JHB]
MSNRQFKATPAYSLLPTPYSLLPTPYCLLPIAYCLARSAISIHLG